MSSDRPPGYAADDADAHSPVPLPPRFRYEHALGEGGLGTVVKAYDTKLRAHVAIKTIRHDLRSRNKEMYDYLLARFDREAIAGARPSVRDSPYVITVYDQVVDQEGNAFLILQFAASGTLADRLRNGPLPIAEALRVTADVARGLQALHAADLVHRDIKPENIFIAADGRAQVGDLGIVQMSTTTFRTRVDYGADRGHPGTPLYMSPEQANTTDVLMPEADQFSLGAVLFEMVTGKRYKGIYPDERQELLATLPPAVASLIVSMTAEQPAARYRGMGGVLAAIEGIARAPAPASVPTVPAPRVMPTPHVNLQPAPVLDRPHIPQQPYPAPRRVSRRAVLTGIGVVVVAGGAAGAIALTHTPTAQGGSPTIPPSLPYVADFRTWLAMDMPGKAQTSADGGGEYHVRNQMDKRLYRVTGALNTDNFVLDIDARFIAGPGDAAYGIVFRVQPVRIGDNEPQMYHFLLTPSGSYYLVLINGDGSITTLQPEKAASAINTGTASNHLRVECRGNQIVVAANGTTLGTYSGPIVASGLIGVAAYNPRAGVTTEAAFKNLRVDRPS